MIPQIMKALDKGFTEDQILNFLVKKFPKFASKIAGAKASGFNPSQILHTLLGDKKKREDVSQPTTEFERMRNRDIEGQERRGQIGKSAAILGATSLAAPIAASALQRAIPNSLQALLPSLTASTIGQDQPQTTTQTPLEQPPINQVASNIPQPANIQQPEVISNPKEYLEKAGVIDTVNDHLKRGTSPEGIAALLSTNMNKKGKLGGKVDPELLKNIEEYAKIPKDQEKISPEIEKPLEPAKIEKNSVVSSPQGIGEVREIRNGQAIIDIDGKLHKVKEKELEPPLYSDDEIADAYDNLMAKIPEKERSGFISWAGYDENTNELGFIPRGGKYEVITDISPEEAKSIKEGTGTARTSGEVREGLWVQGGETRGGVISQIIWDRKRAKDAEEKKQGKFDFNLPKPEKQDRGMKPQFDEMAYARNLSRAREKRARDEERARKKKEKDEAKKRKK